MADGLHLNALFYDPGRDYPEIVLIDRSGFVDKYWVGPLGTCCGLEDHNHIVLADSVSPEYGGYLHAHHVLHESEAL